MAGKVASQISTLALAMVYDKQRVVMTQDVDIDEATPDHGSVLVQSVDQACLSSLTAY